MHPRTALSFNTCHKLKPVLSGTYARRGLGSVVVTCEQAKNNNSLLKTSEGEELINTQGHRQ